MNKAYIDKSAYEIQEQKSSGIIIRACTRPFRALNTTKFYPNVKDKERTASTHWKGGWVGPRAGLDSKIRGKNLCLCRGLNLDRPVVQSVARHYTD
jgi:hypothetical protein